MTIYTQPYELSPVSNDIAYTLRYEYSETLRFIMVKVFIEPQFQSTLQEIATLEAVPQWLNPEIGETTIRIDKLLKSFFDYPTLSGNAALLRSHKQTLRFKIQYAELHTNTEIDELVWTDSSLRYATAAKLSFTQHADYTGTLPTGDLLSTSLAAAPLLVSSPTTTAPLLVSSPTTTLERHQLKWVSFCAAADRTAEINFNLLYADDTTITHTVAFGTVQKGEVYHLPIGLPQRNYPNAHNLVRITFSHAGHTLSFQIYEANDIRPLRALYYFNRLGGIETLIATGASSITYDYKSETFTPYLSPYKTRQQHPQKRYNTTRTPNATASTEYMPAAVAQNIVEYFEPDHYLFLHENYGSPAAPALKTAVVDDTLQLPYENSEDYGFAFITLTYQTA